jgi:metallo-beta-lactamase family protein
LFSGDLGYNFPDQTANLLNTETMLPRSSVTHIVCESTYGDRCRKHEEKNYQNRLNNYKNVLKATVMEEPCRLLIPSFSMHRTQEFILDTYIAAKELQTPMYGFKNESQEKSTEEKGPLIELMVNTPLGDNISRVYKKRLTDFIGKKFGHYKNITPELRDILDLNIKEAHIFLSSLFNYAGTFEWDNKNRDYKSVDAGFKDNILSIGIWNMFTHKKIAAVKNKSQLVIASSGMMSDGPMKSWMRSVLDDPNTYIAVTGYQAEGTIGKKLVDMIEHDQDDFISLGNRIYTKEDIKCKLVHLNGYSGHADQNDLLRWATGNFSGSQKTPRKLILNHGTNAMRESLAEAWREETGQQAIIPTRNKPTIVL